MITTKQQGTKTKVNSPFPAVFVNNRRHLIDPEKKIIQDERMPWVSLKFEELNTDQATSITEQLNGANWGLHDEG